MTPETTASKKKLTKKVNFEIIKKCPQAKEKNALVSGNAGDEKNQATTNLFSNLNFLNNVYI